MKDVKIPDEVLQYFLDQAFDVGKGKIRQIIDDHWKEREEFARNEALQKAEEKKQAQYQEWLQDHYDNIKGAFESDPEYGDLLRNSKIDESTFENLVDGLVGYKNKAPAILKHLLRNQEDLNSLMNSDARDATEMLSDIILRTHGTSAEQQQQPVKEKDVKLPAPKLLPPEGMISDTDNAAQQSDPEFNQRIAAMF